MARDTEGALRLFKEIEETSALEKIIENGVVIRIKSFLAQAGLLTKYKKVDNI
ncbi:MAG: hypothetical protein ACOX1I_06265 [Dethiobacteria bacterium]